MEYTQEQVAFFSDLIKYLKALNDEVLTPEADQRARFLGGDDRADFLRQMALEGKAFLTMPNGRRQYRKIETLKLRDVPDLMREIEYNNVHGGEHIEREPLSNDVNMATFTDPHSRKMAISLEYSTPKPPPEAPEVDHLFYEVLVGWGKLKQQRWK